MSPLHLDECEIKPAIHGTWAIVYLSPFEMDEFYFKCRKCRAYLCSNECLVTPKGVDYETDYHAEDCHDSLWFLNPNNHPVWVAIAVREADYVKGKLKCPKCDAKLGAFDYVSANTCACDQHQTGSIWLVKSKVDLTRTISLPCSRKSSVAVNENTVVPNMPGVVNMEFGESMLGAVLPNGTPPSNSFPRARSRPMAIPANIRYEMEDSDGSDSLSNSPYSAVVGFFDSVFDGANRCNADVEIGDVNDCQTDLASGTDGGLGNETVGNSVSRSSESSVRYESNEHSHDNKFVNLTDHVGVNFGNSLTDRLSESSAESVNTSHSGSNVSDMDNNADSEAGSDDGTIPENSGTSMDPIVEPEVNAGEDFGKIPDVRDMPSELIDAYSCSICLEVYYEPHTCQPCYHIFCSPCLRRLNRSSHDLPTKCPLCRKVISICQLNDDMNEIVKTMFPDEFFKRKSLERKGHDKLLPLPSNKNRLLPPASRRPRHWNRAPPQGSFVLAHWAGVCFVVMLMILGICILATTVAVCAWYVWEVCVDVAIDSAVTVNTLFDNMWKAFARLLPEGNVTPEMAKLLVGSFGQLLHAIGQLFNGSEVPPGAAENGTPLESKDSSSTPFLTEAQQADIANYFLVGGLMTYMIYRFAKYCQARREEARDGQIL